MRGGGRYLTRRRCDRRSLSTLRASDTTHGVQATRPAAERSAHVSTVSLAIAAPLKHNRLTTFFRYFLAIPLLIVN